MRIATSFAYDQSIFNLQQRQQTLADAQVQLTSGKRVNKASDDPTSAARAERALAAAARNEANQRSLDASRNVMNITESALGDAVDLIQSARETLVAAGNGSYTDGERRALAVKLREIRNQMLSVVNRADGGGGFVFGGQGSSAPPFVDTPTGVVRIDRFTAVDDFGTIINPMIVEGQVHGGLVQGIGQALLEHCVYDRETGQLVTGSFMDYAMPRADDVPDFTLGHVCTPCTTNPLGTKGCGEAGAIGSPPAVINAVLDALAPVGVKDLDMPATPHRVWQAIQQARG